MTNVAAFQDPFSEEAYVSNESALVARQIWRLLYVGREMGVSTSMTEAEAERWSDSLVDRFHALAKTWYEASGHLSSVREMVLEPAYGGTVLHQNRFVEDGTAVLPSAPVPIKQIRSTLG